MDYATTILMTGYVTPDTKRFVLSRPEDFEWTPGQGVELMVNEPPWNEEGGRPFTPTGGATDQVLEFIIKRYPEHQGMTERLHSLAPGTELSMSGPFGAINYRGRGTFIAAGAGITPFLAIFRDLERQGVLAGNRLIFSNKRPADVICEKELRFYFGDRALFTCTRTKADGYLDKRIDHTFLHENITDLQQYFYVCGPEAFVEDVKRILREFGAASEALVFEE